MDMKSVLYNSVTISLPKNAVQFLLGIVLFWLVFGSFSYVTATVALAAFILAYSSVYFFNDISDCDEDRCDSEKKEWKLVANGKISKRTAGICGLVLLSAGILLAFAINGWFVSLVVALIALNFLHSSHYTRLKRSMPATAANLTGIEFLKYSSGWFALTSDLTRFPFWLVLTFSLVYTIIYLAYKSRFKGKNILTNKYVIVPLGLISAFSYLVSIFLYHFALPMILLLAVSLALAKFSIGKRIRFMSWLWVEFTVLPMIVIAFVLLSVPSIAHANNNITHTIDQYKSDIYHQLPEDVAGGIRNLTEPRYGSLEEFQDAINQTLNISTIGSLTIFETESGLEGKR